MDPSKETKNKKSYLHKKHCCIFCKNQFTRLAEHFIRKHKAEDKVQEILSISDPKKKLWAWKRLRQQGDNFFNTSNQAGNRIIVKKPLRPSGKKKYFDCPMCLGRIRTCSKIQHFKTCKNILKPDVPDVEIDDDIFDGLSEGVINKIRQNTYLGIFLKDMFEAKQNRKIIRTMARGIISLEDTVKKITGLNKPLTCFFVPGHADDLIKAITTMSGDIKSKDSKERIMKYPYKAQSLCRLINNICTSLMTSYSKKNRDSDTIELTKFINVFKSDAEKLIRKKANRSIKLKNIIKDKNLPKTSQIIVLLNKLKAETPGLIRALENNKNAYNWRKLAENLLCRLTIFNRRRGGAIEKMRIEDYKATEVKLKTATEEATYNLSPEEKEFLGDVKIVEILHKCDNLIPIFITKEIQLAMDILLEARKFGDINEENVYFFAAGKKSMNPISGGKVLEKYREIFPDEIKKLFTATNLRKHGATVAQILNLTPQDKEEWVAHMGHSLSVHNKYYRKAEHINAVLKTGRLLNAMDQGSLKFYKGKKISEIPLRTIKEASTPSAPRPSGVPPASDTLHSSEFPKVDKKKHTSKVLSTLDTPQSSEISFPSNTQSSEISLPSNTQSSEISLPSNTQSSEISLPSNTQSSEIPHASHNPESSNIPPTSDTPYSSAIPSVSNVPHCSQKRPYPLDQRAITYKGPYESSIRLGHKRLQGRRNVLECSTRSPQINGGNQLSAIRSEIPKSNHKRRCFAGRSTNKKARRRRKDFSDYDSSSSSDSSVFF